MRKLWARNVPGLRVGTHYAAQTVVKEVFGEHRRLVSNFSKPNTCIELRTNMRKKH